MPWGIRPSLFSAHFTGIGLVSKKRASCKSVNVKSIVLACLKSPFKEWSHIYLINFGTILAVTEITPWPPPFKKLQALKSSPE